MVTLNHMHSNVWNKNLNEYNNASGRNESTKMHGGAWEAGQILLFSSPQSIWLLYSLSQSNLQTINEIIDV